MKLYFVRHGESEANLLREFSNTPGKHPLTPRGVEQAERLAKQLAGQGIQQIYASPVLRAVQTAEILSASLSIPIDFTAALQEWSVGILEGTREQAGWDLFQQVEDDWFLHHKLDSKIPGGESFLEIQARFVPFIDGLVAQDRYQSLLLVGHGGLYRAMLPVVFKNVSVELATHGTIHNTAYALGETRPDGLYCLEWFGTPI